ncbi:hypothetical protein MSS4_02737 [Mycobacterium marinum]|nr:hypothetical protein MSS4_02737 [Mycobacterium marinum]
MSGEAALLSARSNSDLECVGGKVILGGPATASEPVVRAATMAVNRCATACISLALSHVFSAKSYITTPAINSPIAATNDAI